MGQYPKSFIPIDETKKEEAPKTENKSSFLNRTIEGFKELGKFGLTMAEGGINPNILANDPNISAGTVMPFVELGKDLKNITGPNAQALLNAAVGNYTPQATEAGAPLVKFGARMSGIDPERFMEDVNTGHLGGAVGQLIAPAVGALLFHKLNTLNRGSVIEEPINPLAGALRETASGDFAIKNPTPEHVAAMGTKGYEPKINIGDETLFTRRGNFPGESVKPETPRIAPSVIPNRNVDLGGLFDEPQVAFEGIKNLDKTREGYHVYYNPTGDVIRRFNTAEEATSFTNALQRTGADVDWAPDLDTAVENFHQATKEPLVRQYEPEKWDTLPKIEVPTAQGKGELYIHNDGGTFSPAEMETIKANPGVQNLGGKVLDIAGRMQEILRASNSPFFGDVLKTIPEKTGKIGISFGDPELINKGINWLNSESGKTAILIDPSYFIENGTPRQSAFGVINSIAHELAHNIDRTESKGHSNIQGEILRLFANEFSSHFDDLTNVFGDANGYRPEFSNLLSITGAESRLGRSTKLPTIGQTPGRTGQTIETSREGGISKGATGGGNEAVSKLLEALKAAKPLRGLQESIYSAERARRIGAAINVSTRGEKGFYEQLGHLRGPMEKVTVESIRPKLTQPEIDTLINTITDSNLNEFQKIHAKSGLIKILGEYGSQVPQNSEIALLDQVFGGDFGKQLVELYGGLGAVKTPIIHETVNMPKSIMASVDLSGPFRQGLGLADRTAFWKSFGTMIKAFGSEKAYNAIQESIRTDPLYPTASIAKLGLTDLGNLTSREEAFMSKYAEKLPLVKRSARAYTAFLNKVRFDVFKDLLKKAEAAGNQNMKLATDEAGNPTGRFNPLIGEIADFVNNASGRGNLGRFEKNAVELNSVFFSPRLIASRLNMLNPMKYVKADPFVRVQMLRSIASTFALGTALVEFARAMGWGTVSNDPNSSDFRKLQIGNTRLDPYGGFQQYAVAFSRILSGKSTTVEGHEYELGSKYGTPTRLDILERFGISKLSPIGGLIATILQQNDFQGAPIDVKAKVIDLFVPMLINDMYQLAKDDPTLIPLSVFAGLGFGMQTFDQSSIGDDASAMAPSLGEALDMGMSLPANKSETPRVPPSFVPIR